jgi:hypothetical protein
MYFLFLLLNLKQKSIVESLCKKDITVNPVYYFFESMGNEFYK